MKAALKCAQKAYEIGEVPIGAVVVKDGKIISRGYNKRSKKQLATAHAEVEAIDKACKKLGSWRIPECDIYVTLEPCPMCLGTMLNARIKSLYFGAYEKKGTALTMEIAQGNIVNHKIEVTGGVMAEECSAIISRFFSKVRVDLKKQKEKDEALTVE